MTAPAELREGADALRRIQTQQQNEEPDLRPGERLLGQVDQLDGSAIRFVLDEWRDRFGIRLFINSGNERFPAKGAGISVPCCLLPGLADAVARAMDEYRAGLERRQTRREERKRAREQAPRPRVYLPDGCE